MVVVSACLLFVCLFFVSRLERQVRDVVHKAFWDKLREEISQEPPVYNQALSLLQELKEVNYTECRLVNQMYTQ